MQVINETVEEKNSLPLVLKLTSSFLSYIFHPLFIPLYAGYFLMFIHPTYFVGYASKEKYWLLIRVAYTMVFFPVITVLLLKAIGFIESVFLKTQKDRIIPYIACGIYFFWGYLVFRNQPSIPSTLTSFTFAVFLSSSVALIANIYFKISMHAIGMGGVLGLFVVIMRSNTMLMTGPLSVAFLITGMVCTARLLITNHSNKEIYIGLLVGIVCQLVAAVII